MNEQEQRERVNYKMLISLFEAWLKDELQYWDNIWDSSYNRACRERINEVNDAWQQLKAEHIEDDNHD
jgi:hypothetical protein